MLVQIYIKDVKSSNGTFINGERLSPEGLESDPFELKSDDIVVRLSFKAITALRKAHLYIGIRY
jgi:pSer/pThr/pTyr-binding forkhead associated (FHA) protein